MKIAIAGTGYVGLANAILLAQHNEVIAFDIDEARVARINMLEPTVEDLDMQCFLKEKALNIRATTDWKTAYSGADFVIVATPTNYIPENNTFDTSTIESVIANVITTNPKATIIIKSTVPVGYTARFNTQAAPLGLDGTPLRSENVIFSPEFLREGKALYDNLYPSRIVIGEISERARVFAELLKQGAAKSDVQVMFVKNTEAEAIKLFSNSYLAMRVAFFNELDTYAETHGLDSGHLIGGVGLDPRIGSHYNNPSFGYGGYCLPKDTKQLVASFKDIPNRLVRAIVDANETRKRYVAETIIRLNPNCLGIYRLVMKEGSDNFRDAAILDILKELQARGVNVVIYEPVLDGEEFMGCRVEYSLDDFKQTCDVIVANRISAEIIDVRGKVYSRDIFGGDT